MAGRLRAPCVTETGGTRAKLGVEGKGRHLGSKAGGQMQTPGEWEKPHKRKPDTGPPVGSAPRDGDPAHKEEDKRRITVEVMGPRPSGDTRTARKANRGYLRGADGD